MKRSIIRASSFQVSAVLLACVLVLSGCERGDVGGGPVAAAIAVGVPQGAGNPANVINTATAGMVDVIVTLPADSAPGDVVTVILSDGLGTEASAQGQGSGQSGGGDVTVQVDASGLGDGMIDVTVTSQTDTGTGQTSFQDVFTKDTTPPELPTVVEPLDAQGAASAYFNIATTPSASVRALFAATSSQDSAQVNVRDAMTTVNGPVVSGYAASVVSFDALDLTTLADGVVDVEIVVTDPNLNSATMMVQATKDTVAPQAATTAQISMSASNPANVINITTSAGVTVDVGFGPDTEARNLRVLLGDGSTTAASASVPADQAGGSLALDSIGATLLVDGPVSVVAEMTDLAGNVTAIDGTGATKDTLAPIGPSSAAVLAGTSNPPSVMNLVSASSVSVGVNWPAFAQAGDVATIALDVGGTTVTSAPITVPSGGGSTTVGGMDCSSLGEGAVVMTITVTEPSGNTLTVNGTPAMKDTIPPMAPTVARVAGGGANNADIINIASQSSVMGLVNFPGATVGDETYAFGITDGPTNVMTGTMTAPAGGGSVNVGPMNCTGLVDGFVTISVTVTDPAQNVTAMTGTSAMKDTVAPTAPIAASIDAGGNNAQHVVNIASASAAAVSVTWPASAPGSETAQLSLTGGGSVSSAVSQSAGGGVATVSGLDLTGLSDGAVALSVVTTDSAGNTASFNGTSATKDTVAPTGPSTAAVSPGTGNGPHVINVSNVSAVSVDFTWPAGSSSSDVAQVALSNGGTVTAGASPTNGAGASTTANIDTSSLSDGTITVMVTTTDAAGNSTAFNGTAANKDTVVPLAATSVGVPGGPSNPSSWINLATVGAVTVDVTMPAGSTGSETVALSCTDGVSTVTTGSQPVLAGGGVVTFPNVNLSGLVDGAVTITATVSEPSQNSATTSSAGVAKDTIPPANPTNARVPAGMSNPVDMINSFTYLASDVSVGWPGDTGGEAMYVVLSDGVNSQASTTQMLGGGPATVGFNGLDCSSLTDGNVSITVSITDTAWNTGSFTGTSATKDTVGPVAPTSAHVIPTAGNPIDVISAASAASTTCSVVFAGSASASDVATMTLSDGMIGVSTGAQPVTPGGTVNYAGINAGGLADGGVTVSVNVIDAAGNVTTWAGTAATKDTVAPSPATAVAVAAGGNPAGYVNISSQSAVAIDLTVPSNGSGITAFCGVSDGTTLVSTSSMAAPAGGGAMSFTGLDCSGLADGTLSMTATLTDAAGNTATFNGSCTKDTVAPTVIVDPITVQTQALQQLFTGESEPAASMTITGGSSPATASADVNGRFGIMVPLNFGNFNVFTVSTSDAAGNVTMQGSDFTGGTLFQSQSPFVPPMAFTDVTTSSGLGAVTAAQGGSFQDLDGDGDLDLFVGGSNTLWRNDGFGGFADVTASAGGPFAGGASSVFGDYDNDGDLDLVTVDGTNVALWRNDSTPDGLKFVDVTASTGAGVTGTLSGAYFGDVDADGYADIMLMDAGMSGPVFVQNAASATFTQATGFLPLTLSNRFGVVADIIQNGYSDFVFGDASPSFFYQGIGSLSFFQIAGPGTVSIDHANAAGGMIVADYDNDGDLDLVVAAGGALAPSASCGGCMLGNNQLFRNEGTSTFTTQVTGQNLALLAGIEPSDGWRDICAGDIDNDGRLDLCAAQANTVRLFLNVGDATLADGVWEYVEVAGSCGLAGTGLLNLVQMADIDGDGDLDLFAPTATGTNAVYRNDVNNRRNLTVKVQGLATGAGSSSRDGVGAHVELLDHAGATVLASREINGGRGYGSQDPMQVHFGVAPSWLYTVRVTFPSGRVALVKDIVPRTTPAIIVTEE